MTSQIGSSASSAEPLSWTPYETRMGVGWIGWSGSVIDQRVTDQKAIAQIVLPGLPMPPCGWRAISTDTATGHPVSNSWILLLPRCSRLRSTAPSPQSHRGTL